MKALVIRAFGGPEVLEEAELPDPVPGPGEARVRVHAVVVARTKDVAARAGKPPFAQQITSLPHVLGTEHAGVIDQVGPGLDDDLVGKRVAVSAVLSCSRCRACGLSREEACSEFRLVGIHRQGSYAEYCVVPVKNVREIPAEVGFVEAAALAANGGVASAQLDAGEVGLDTTVLVPGAGGALGATVAALAAFRGARVIGVDRRPPRLAGLPLVALDAAAQDLPERILEAVGSAGLDCVVDNLGVTALCEAYLPALGALGRVVVSGAINHDPIPIRLLQFYLRSQSLIGVRTGNRRQIDRLWADVSAGFRPPAGFVHEIPWTQVSDAHASIQSGGTHGQLVLTVDGS
ncbi:alcohol dehydrogenase [Amycolatopsis sp. WAC 04197]|uniref:quinone oxidoreductase family protein n=1 Tax=Amycolatopsis sp. WAC 04197 TaxID=2203199 RepID=UPI000F772A7B|nr:alcohol dehydrogenase catalytic domain-containing protein [Amycolatopsis sp. WAC 04197]RSN39894.1 alcohol dehydrogenase [Amycolatopsis sp. WAC 04197]